MIQPNKSKEEKLKTSFFSGKQKAINKKKLLRIC